MSAAAGKGAPHPGDGLGQRFDNLAHGCRDALPLPLWRALTIVPPPADPEERLFRDVIARACLDAIGHLSPLGGGSAPGVIVSARAWFAADRDPWREAVFAFANYDEGLIVALVRAAVIRLEREQGIVAAPPAVATKAGRKAEMPGTEPFAPVRGPRRPFAVERIKRRVSLRDREAASVIFSYLTRSNAHAESAPR